MSELNEKFPEILLAYIADVGCEFSNSRLNELSKFVSELELDIAHLAQSNLALTAKIDTCESALISMVQQYLYRPLDPTTNKPADNIYQHDFMSAGEEAFAYLVEHGLAEWTDDRYWAIRMKESEEE